MPSLFDKKMANLDTISAELYNSICEHIRPKDQLNLALACKASWNMLSSSMVHHKHFYKKYGNLNLDGNRSLSLLRTIVQKPHIAEYIDCLSRGQSWNFHDTSQPGGDFADETETHLDEGLVVHVMDFFENSSLIPPDFSQYTELAQQGNQTLRYLVQHAEGDADITFILLHAPYLRTLKFEQLYHSGGFIEVLFSLASSYILKSARGLPYSSLPLSSLTTVVLGHADLEGSLDIKLIWSFLQLPSIRSLTATTIEIYDEDEDDFEFPSTHNHVSRIKEVKFESATFPGKVMAGLLRNMEALESFHFLCHLCGPSIDPVGSYLGSLLKYSGRSLKQLEICGTSEWYNNGDYGTLVRPSLREFQQLERLRGSVVDLFPVYADDVDDEHIEDDIDDDHGDHSVDEDTESQEDSSVKTAARMPESLVTLELNEFDADKHKDLVLEVLQDTKALLPNLRYLTLGTRDRIPPSITQAIEKACIKAGVDLKTCSNIVAEADVNFR